MTDQARAFQNASSNLLRVLYIDKKLPPTRGMIWVIQGYYPSIKDTLDTLDTYDNEPEVIKFVSENAEAIDHAKESIKTSKSQTEIPSMSDRFGDLEDEEIDPFRSSNAYGDLKKFSISDIELAISVALQNLCGAPIEATITSFNSHLPESNKVTVSMNLE